MNRSTSSTFAFTSSSDWQSSIRRCWFAFFASSNLLGDLEEVFAFEVELRREPNEVCDRDELVPLGDVNDVNNEAIDLSSLWRESSSSSSFLRVEERRLRRRRVDDAVMDK